MKKTDPSKVESSLKFDEIEKTIGESIRGTEFEGLVYLVGGACRDYVLGVESLDWDLVVEKKGGAQDLAEFLSQKFDTTLSRPHPVGKGYPIWQLVVKDPIAFPAHLSIEIADSQSEMFPDPTSRDRVTKFGTLEDDCKRRDLTINMLYRDVLNKKWRDPSNCALEDIQKKRIRGYPGIDLDKIFSDDPLRILRLVRFQTILGWGVDPETVKAAKRQIPRLSIVSFERIRDEWEKLLEVGLFYSALETYQKLGILEVLFPEFLPMIGCEQDKLYHTEGDVWVHTLGVIKNCGRSKLLQLTALLHDIGKPATQTFVGTRIKFIDHEKHSVEIANRFLDKMRYGTELKDKILKLVALHLRGGDVSRWSTNKPARKLLRDAGELIDELIEFIEADSKFTIRENGLPDLSHIPLLREKIEEAKKIPVSSKPSLSGTELMDKLSREPGPWIKDLQSKIRDFEDDFIEKNNYRPTLDQIWNFIHALKNE